LLLPGASNTCKAVIQRLVILPMVSKQDFPWPLRIPKDWRPEIEVEAKRRDVKQHRFLVDLIREGLDRLKPLHRDTVEPRFKKGEKK
jgi:hypothetical protein